MENRFPLSEMNQNQNNRGEGEKYFPIGILAGPGAVKLLQARQKLIQ
jgi:hypothetical protein